MKRIITFVFIFLIAFTAAPAIQAQAPSGTFRQEGIASWYGSEYDGRPTASGEIFNSTLFTAAHPSLPFGTILTVTNTHNNKQVMVRVNDRGPFVSARIIDLSRAAAEALDMIVTGTAPVIVESSIAMGLGPVPAQPVTTYPGTAPVTTQPLPTQPATTYPGVAPVQQTAPVTSQTPYAPVQEPVYNPVPQAPLATTPVYNNTPTINIIGGFPQTGTGKHYRLQVGAYKIPRNAVDTFERLRDVGLSPLYEVFEDTYRVVLANLNPEDIPYIAEILAYAGFREALLREER
ncbi:MAG: septal ring lytic transglycosylase RlpA family protein [Treponema sp.]|jgi:rare lipoprotein A|nr:septal ring lytic transglycosylase RlpA family protein [Treponema sp.]